MERSKSPGEEKGGRKKVRGLKAGRRRAVCGGGKANRLRAFLEFSSGLPLCLQLTLLHGLLWEFKNDVCMYTILQYIYFLLLLCSKTSSFPFWWKKIASLGAICKTLLFIFLRWNGKRCYPILIRKVGPLLFLLCIRLNLLLTSSEGDFIIFYYFL